MNTLGKWLMTVAIAIFTIIPPLVDLLTDSHVFHEGWLPHARMHTVWLLGLTSGVGLISLYLLWIRKTELVFATNLAGLLSGCVYGAFFLSAITTQFYGGSLSDIVGNAESGPFGLNGNVFTFSVASTLLVVGWVICQRQRTT